MSKEKEINAKSGWGMLAVAIIIFVVCGLLFASGDEAMMVIGAVVLVLNLALICKGFFTLQPNEARVCVLFGKYKGTVKKSGFYWVNPFYSSSVSGAKGSKVSLRARTLNGDRIKVNDKLGNPIEIAMVVVWRVQDTAQAIFDVENYQMYVTTQSETALRHVATAYAYDHGEEPDGEEEITLRSNVEEVSAALKAELANKLAVAGVVVDDARLTHLAYSPEIAQAMLRRQQAEAVIAARKKIVEGAVGMVEMALDELQSKDLLEMDAAHKAAMVGNLMVVLCSDSEAQPVVNTSLSTD